MMSLQGLDLWCHYFDFEAILAHWHTSVNFSLVLSEERALPSFFGGEIKGSSNLRYLRKENGSLMALLSSKNSLLPYRTIETG